MFTRSLARAMSFIGCTLERKRCWNSRLLGPLLGITRPLLTFINVVDGISAMVFRKRLTVE